MKKIKIYIVTYNRPKALNKTINKIFNTSWNIIPNNKKEIIVINNHTNFYLTEENKNRVTVLHNQTRPDYSLGNLSESWNQCLINGFKDLNNPDTEILCTLQDDCHLHQDWFLNLLEMHRNYDFIFGSLGDNFVSYKANAVKKIGLWDENFCGIQYKEADYCIRALIHLNKKSIINDKLANLYHNHSDWLSVVVTEGLNYVKNNNQIIRKPDNDHHNKIKIHSTSHRQILLNYFNFKWKNTWKEQPAKEGWICNWTNDFVKNPPKFPAHFQQHFRYYYFEKNIENLKQKGYLV